MHQLSDKIRLQEQAEQEQESEEQEAKLAEQTVEKHWGSRRKASSKKLMVVGDEADAAADRYEQRQVGGLKLLVDPAEAARKLVDEVKTKRLAQAQTSRKQLPRSHSAAARIEKGSVRLCDVCTLEKQ
jgi:RNA polymerase-binding transcription factor DksA